jgi:hypothetical protein
LRLQITVQYLLLFPLQNATNFNPLAIIQGAISNVKNRLTPIQLGESLIRVSLTQTVKVEKEFKTRLNMTLNMNMLPNTPPQACFEVLAQTEELENGRKFDAYVKTTNGAPEVLLRAK